jgi:ABC-2 type transport system ATP-binding protein
MKGVTIILTTHYIEEAESIADRVGIINYGKIIVVDKKDELIKKLGQKKLIIELQEKIAEIPNNLKYYNLVLKKDGTQMIYTYDTKNDRTGITTVLNLILLL